MVGFEIELTEVLGERAPPAGELAGEEDEGAPTAAAVVGRELAAYERSDRRRHRRRRWSGRGRRRRRERERLGVSLWVGLEGYATPSICARFQRPGSTAATGF